MSGGLPRLLTLLLVGVAAIAATWTGLRVAGAAAGPYVLPRGEEKSFGFFDAHLHIAVLDVAVSRVWGTTPARGEFHAVRIRARSDAARILIDPSRLRIVATDDLGQEHAPLGPDSVDGPPIDADAGGVLRPGDSRERTLLFDLPPDTRHATLWITYGGSLARWIPDDKRGLLLREVGFDLGDPAH